jgi:hypothetical protein
MTLVLIDKRELIFFAAYPTSGVLDSSMGFPSLQEDQREIMVIGYNRLLTVT